MSSMKTQFLRESYNLLDSKPKETSFLDVQTPVVWPDTQMLQGTSLDTQLIP